VYVTVVAEEQAQYSFYTIDAAISINYVVFFFVFFSCFFLSLTVALGVVHLRTLRIRLAQQHRARAAMEALASRPMASIALILDGEHQKPGPKHRDPTGVFPLCVQPTYDGQAMIATYMMSSPSGPERKGTKLVLASTLFRVGNPRLPRHRPRIRLYVSQGSGSTA
jgi:hypothetical protein